MKVYKMGIVEEMKEDIKEKIKMSQPINDKVYVSRIIKSEDGQETLRLLNSVTAVMENFFWDFELRQGETNQTIYLYGRRRPTLKDG